MMFKVVLSVLVFLQSAIYSNGIVTDKEYALMPDLFQMDNYDICMLLQDEAFYCYFTFELTPLHTENATKVWKIIKEVSSDPMNYRHDRLRHGICVPKTCPNVSIAKEDDPELWKGITDCYNEKFRHLELNGAVTEMRCLTTEPRYKIDYLDIGVAVFLLTYVIFVIIASFYEGVARYGTKEHYDKVTGTTFGKIMATFSIPRNWYRLKTINDTPDVRRLRCIQGIRFYNMICVIMCHTVMTFVGSPVMNPQYTETMTKKFLNMILSNGGFAVQTFFLISGWLFAYHFFTTFEGKKKVSVKYLVLAFINRYIRLTPTVAVVIAIHSTWLVHFSDGPMWDFWVGKEYRNCRKNWWSNLLYINNYVDRENMCLQQTWYLACDMQLFVLSLFVLTLMWKNQNHIKLILGTSISIGVLIPGLICYINKYDIVVRQYPEPLMLLMLKVEQWHELYSSGYSNIGGYMIGIMFGYIFYKYKDYNLIKNKMYVVVWYFLTYGLALFIILIAYRMYQPGYVYNRLEAALYWSSGKNVFAFSLGIAILGLTQKIGWFTRWFCEWHVAQILGRLTYSAYITHVAFVKLKTGIMRQPLYLSDFFIFTNVLSDITLAYLVATLVTLFLEMPISALQKLYVPQQNQRKDRVISEKSLQTILDLESDCCKQLATNVK